MIALISLIILQCFSKINTIVEQFDFSYNTINESDYQYNHSQAYLSI